MSVCSATVMPWRYCGDRVHVHGACHTVVTLMLHPPDALPCMSTCFALSNRGANLQDVMACSYTDCLCILSHGCNACWWRFDVPEKELDPLFCNDILIDSVSKLAIAFSLPCPSYAASASSLCVSRFPLCINLLHRLRPCWAHEGGA